MVDLFIQDAINEESSSPQDATCGGTGTHREGKTMGGGVSSFWANVFQSRKKNDILLIVCGEMIDIIRVDDVKRRQV